MSKQYVHTDDGQRKAIGLIQPNGGGSLIVPFTRIHAEINLAA